MILRSKTPLLFTLVSCLIPLLWLFADIALNNLGSNPIQALHIRLGDWSLRFLCLTLAITPIQMVTKWRGMASYRQLFGLYAFLYGTLHLLTYLVVDNNLEWSLIGTDILESPYIWFGVLAYVIVFLLGVTTSKWSKKRLGKTWKKLHRFVYVASVAAIIHYFWQLKGNLAEPLLYLIIIFFLLSFRVLTWVMNRQKKLNKPQNLRLM
ncbi:MAG: sulfoxide reductase heme-binding subunit YedZ [Methylococcales bacterium]|nr:sulfoxide reductase heme-binding subunit YedZ [Methylococcales bacterium]MDD5754181.1 sulfoxide reductase heme-binding subunit YedZ [Methylococcales bacterium]